MASKLRAEEDGPLSFALSECSLGWVLVASSGRGVCAVFMGDDPRRLTASLMARFPGAMPVQAEPEHVEGMSQVVHLIEEPECAADMTAPLDLRGTPFQLRVWEAVREIGPGETESYAEVAHRIGMPLAARAVGGACARSAHAIVIPCHRVIAADGSLGGYGGSLDLKRRLLEREQR